MNTDTLAAATAPAPARSRRTLAACCGAHVLHDGFSDMLYVLFPVWQAAFGLSFAQVGMLKTLYSGSMAALQVPASLLAERVGERVLLALGTLVAAAAFIASGWTAGFLGLALCLMVGGAGRERAASARLRLDFARVRRREAARSARHLQLLRRHRQGAAAGAVRGAARGVRLACGDAADGRARPRRGAGDLVCRAARAGRDGRRGGCTCRRRGRVGRPKQHARRPKERARRAGEAGASSRCRRSAFSTAPRAWGFSRYCPSC